MRSRAKPIGIEPTKEWASAEAFGEALLDGVLGTIAEGLILADEQGKILRMNSAAERLWGYYSAEAEGRELGFLLGSAAKLPAAECDPDPQSRRGRAQKLDVRDAQGATIPVAVHVCSRGEEGRRFLIAAVQDLRVLASERLQLRQLEKAVETMQVGVTITDAERRILYVNPAEAEMHGYEVDELIGREVTVFAPPDLWSPMSQDQLSGVGSWKRESVNLRKDGTRFPVEILSDVVTDADGQPAGIVSISRDISERKESEEALRQSEERYALAVRGANDGIWDWDLKNDRMFFSHRWKEMLGLGDSRIDEHSDEWLKRVHPEDRERLEGALKEHLEGRSKHFECEHRMRHADGTHRLMLCRGIAVRDDDGKAYRMAGSLTDITDRKAHDPLTGLPNRALFLDRLSTALARTQRRPGRLTAVLFLDLDRFKRVNDSFGHLVGDQLLVSVARRIEASLRPGDSVARIGGDEMTVLLEDLPGVEHTKIVASRIHERLKQPFHFVDLEFFVTVSVGIAVSSSGLEDPAELLHCADSAMYRAKSEGRGRTVLFDHEMRRRAAVQLQLETDLRHAMQARQMEVHYQPIVSSGTNRVTGFEALLRWRHPERGLLYPQDFIATAEETGLIVGLGRWILREACQQLRAWHDEFPAAEKLEMHVNLSAKQFDNPDLVYHVEHALQNADLDPRYLTVEITEATLIDNMEGASETVEELRKLGVRVCIDDFGTGYSSLTYLQKLPVSGLKIDRSFVHQIDEGGRNAELVQAIVKLASELGIDVVAEGVETDAELETLRKLACGLFQGYCHSEPVSAQEIRPLLETLGQ